MPSYEVRIKCMQMLKETSSRDFCILIFIGMLLVFLMGCKPSNIQEEATVEGPEGITLLVYDGCYYLREWGYDIVHHAACPNPNHTSYE